MAIGIDHHQAGAAQLDPRHDVRAVVEPGVDLRGVGGRARLPGSDGRDLLVLDLADVPGNACREYRQARLGERERRGVVRRGDLAVITRSTQSWHGAARDRARAPSRISGYA